MRDIDSNDSEGIIDPRWGEEIVDAAQVLDISGFEHIGEIAQEFLGGIGDWFRGIGERISRYVNDTQQRLTDDVELVTSKPWQTLISMFVPVPPDSIRDLPRFLIEVGQAILVDKFKKSKTFQIISTIVDVLTGGWFKPVLKRLFEPIKQAITKRILNFLTSLSTKWANFIQFKWPKIVKFLKALKTGLWKGLKGAFTKFAGGLKKAVPYLDGRLVTAA